MNESKSAISYRFLASTIFLLSFLFLNCSTISSKSANAGVLSATNSDSSSTQIKNRPEHVEMNLANNADIIKWYEKNLGFKILRQSPAPAFNSFVGDSSQHMLFELQNISDSPYLDLANIHHMSLHFAFVVANLETTSERLLQAGCKVAEAFRTSNSGDKVITLRDPWNLSIQFVQRAKPMLSFSEMRFEHLAINVEDPVALSKWFVDNLGMRIIKQGAAPSFGTFIVDAKDNFTFELYHNKDIQVIDFKSLHYNSIHFAFETNDIVAAKEKLLKNGAVVAEELKTTPSGDQVVMLRNPWGIPTQLVMRKNPMLK
jgi:glyoxylase I family protein